MQGSFSVWTDHKKGHTKVKELARFKPMQRHLFLHEKAVLFCKKREESGEGYEKAPSYSYKQSLNVSGRLVWCKSSRRGPGCSHQRGWDVGHPAPAFLPPHGPPLCSHVPRGWQSLCSDTCLPVLHLSDGRRWHHGERKG